MIAGSTGIRYSSTHRVAREGQGTWQYIRDKIQAFRSAGIHFDLSKGTVSGQLSSPRKKLISHVRAQQNLMTEIEFEWLRQWYVQGKKHASLHPYWHRSINVLGSSLLELGKASLRLINLLRELSHNGRRDSHVTEDLFDVLIESLTERHTLRLSWLERYQDPVFDDMPAEERPFPCPCLDGEKDTTERMPENLELLVSQLRQWRSTFVASEKSGEHDDDTGSAPRKKRRNKSNKAKTGSLTKKESKQRNSNWERLKASLKGG